MGFEFTELKRLVANMILIGLVHEVDHDTCKVKVSVGELVTGWLPWPANIGRNYVAWRPLKPGIQVVLVCPSGDPAQAVIIQTLYTTDIDTRSNNADVDVIEFEDGTQISYNSSTKQLLVVSADSVTIQSNGDTQVTALGHCKIDAAQDLELCAGGNIHIAASKVVITAPVEQTGGDITSDGISVQYHRHPVGTPLVGEPVK